MTRIRSSKPELTLNLPPPAVRPPIITERAAMIAHIRTVVHRQIDIRQAPDTFPVQADVVERKSWSERWLDDLSHES